MRWVSCVVVMVHEGNVEGCIPEKSERSRRIHALGVALTACLLLSIAFILSPSKEGIGTHRQLGLPQCGWILAAGYSLSNLWDDNSMEPYRPW